MSWFGTKVADVSRYYCLTAKDAASITSDLHVWLTDFGLAVANVASAHANSCDGELYTQVSPDLEVPEDFKESCQGLPIRVRVKVYCASAEDKQRATDLARGMGLTLEEFLKTLNVYKLSP